MSKESRPRKLVVAGLVLQGDTVLLTQRATHQAMPLKWEFPGGKIEAGESPDAALRRELSEEIGVDVHVHRIWDVLFHSYPDFDLLMLMYPCTLVGTAKPRCIDVADLVWVRPEEMRKYDILAADAPLVERLIEEGIPGPASHN